MDRKILIFLLTLTFPFMAQAFPLLGFKTPESFIIDPSTGIFYVSNSNGSPGVRDRNGFISKIVPGNPQEIDHHFVVSGQGGATLNAPTGLAIIGNELWATDIDTVKRFDKSNGRFIGGIDLSGLGARLLYGLAEGPDGLVFVSDPTADTIFSIDRTHSHQAQILVREPNFGGPTGLKYDPVHNRLVAVTQNPGKIYGVDLKGKIRTLFHRRFKQLVGVDFDREGNLVFSARGEGKIYRLSNYSQLETIREHLITPTGISYDFTHHRILVPSEKGNMIFTISLE